MRAAEADGVEVAADLQEVGGDVLPAEAGALAAGWQHQEGHAVEAALVVAAQAWVPIAAMEGPE